MNTLKLNPNTKRTVRIAYVDVIGKIWMPATTAAMTYKLSDYDLRNIEEFTRDNVEGWLTYHSGDFQSIQDFRGQCGDVFFDFKDEESELTFNDCMFPEEA